MPAKNSYKTQKKEANTFRYSSSPLLSRCLRISYERLNMSRDPFYLSKNPVNTNKRNHSIKRPLKPSYEKWLTSSKFGSRDCVLVFRTSILNRPDLSCSLEPLASCVLQCDGCCSNTSLYSAKSKSVHAPNNKDDTKNCSGHTLNMEAEQLPKAQLKMNKAGVGVMIPDSMTKLLNVSLSSSDTSLSSDYDELQESDSAETKKLLSCNAKLQNKFKGGCVEDVNSYIAIEQITENEAGNHGTHRKENEEDDCAYSQYMPASELNIKYKFITSETKLLRRIFVRHGLSETDDDNFSILWSGVHMKPDILRNLAPYQRVNHYPRSFELTRKDLLYKNIERMQRLRGQKHFDMLPPTFILPIEYRDLISSHNKNRGPWIVKPAASSRGRGIFIVNSPDQIPQDEQVLVSKYIGDPLCIDGHKCDVRVYVLVTSFDPLIVYLYEEGLVRLATVKYERNADNLWNPCMHLCNYSINKYHSDYIQSSDVQDENVGHKWTLSALLRHLKSQGCDTRGLMCNIEDLVIKSVLACAQSIISACRMFVQSSSNCFELYGVDILIDEALKPWLLEVNLSPSMGVDSPLDTKVKACLLTDLLTCVGIPAYSSSMRAHYDIKWSRFCGVGHSSRNNPAVGAIRKSSKESPSLTIEEQRIVRNTRLQNARRGGFVRIFPTEDSMHRYGMFLDSATGIPLSTSAAHGQPFCSMILPHNYNQMLFDNLYGKNAKDNGGKEGNSLDERVTQYERILEAAVPVNFPKKKIEPKCEEQCRRLRHQIYKLISTGSELTQYQARQTFALYLAAVLRRLTQEPRDCHEKLILKFVCRADTAIKAPLFCRNPQNSRVISKAHSAMTAKLLVDFLEQYNHDTEAYVDCCDHYGMIPTALFNQFLAQAQEADLESILVLVTSITGTMPYLYNRCGLSVPPTPPIPSGVHGFLRALPEMVVGCSAARDINNYLKINEKKTCEYNEKIRTPIYF